MIEDTLLDPFFGKKWLYTIELVDRVDGVLCFGTNHPIDGNLIKIFEDLLNRSLTHWTDGDIANFLACEGVMMYKSAELNLPELLRRETFVLNDEQLAKVKTACLCVYGGRSGLESKTVLDDFDRIVYGIAGFLPNETEMRVGYIHDENIAQNQVLVHLIAICSES